MFTPLTKALAALGDVLVNPRRPSDLEQLAHAVAGKKVLVTGASFGLGAATAKLLGRAGATVLLAARTVERLEEVAQEITATGGAAYVYPCDLADPVAAEALAGTLLAEHGHVDVVVNNAGKSIRRSVDTQYDRFHDFERTVAVNYLGPVQLLLALLPSMRARGEGLIVNISTLGVIMEPAPRWGAYIASKAAFDTWLRSITPEIKADGVAVSTIYAGVIYTRMSAPTPILRKVPGLRSAEAAWLVARAIMFRERAIGPWWMEAAELTGTVLRGPISWGMGLMYKLTSDIPAAVTSSPESSHPSSQH